jgi:protein TonB
MQKAVWVADLVSDFNDTLENAVRLAAFEVAVRPVNEGGQGNSNPVVANQAQTSSQSKSTKKPQKGLKDLKLSDLAITPLEVVEVNKKPVIAEQNQQAQHGKGKGVSSSNDFVEELPLGDFTKMNTVEFKHFGFYQRIKHKLEQYWGASLRENAEKIFKQGRKLAAENYVTSLVIEMDSNGQIVHVHVKGSSGVSELDDAAIDSFNKAGPFPNPPKDLLHAGRAKIEWGFVVKS